MKSEKSGTRTTRARNKQRWKEEKTRGKTTKPSECMKERKKNNEGRKKAQWRRDQQSEQLKIQTKVQKQPELKPG